MKTDFTQLKGRMAQAGKGGHIEVSDLERNALIEQIIEGVDAWRTPIIDHGTSDTTFALTPNALHKWGEVQSLTLTLEPGDSGYVNEYMFEFISGANATELTLPDTVIWGTNDTIEANKIYQVSVLNNIALMAGADISSE